MEVNKTVALHIVEMVSLATANHEIDTTRVPGVDLVRIPVGRGIAEGGGLVRVDK
jgi:hypothetical protein